jgi:cyclopropane-fatty-acyl-phospholipid synthase
MALSRTEPLRREILRAIPQRPFTVEFWDGSAIPASNGAGGPTFRVRSPQAVAHALRAPGQLGIGRAYATGLIEVDDLDAAMDMVATWRAPAIDGRDRARLAFAALQAVGLTRPPRIPASELRPHGTPHSKERDARSVRFHYDVSNEFFELFLGPSMTYSCAIFSRGATTLEEAQATKLDLVATKLALQPGERVLDVGCGWGSFAIHAAKTYGVHVTGITLSEPQAREAQRRAVEAGVGELVDCRVTDYRDVGGEPFDAIASIGMVEHVGEVQVDEYARQLARMLKPGGRLLNHGIARLRHSDPDAGPFSERYVWPDAEPLHLSRILTALERAGFENEHVEGFRLDYAETLRHWAANLDAGLERAISLAGPERVRIWRLYLRAARNGFLSGFTSVYQVKARKAF